MKAKTLLAFVGGIAAGAVLGALLAPEKGEKTRKKLKSLLEEFCEENGFCTESSSEEEEPEADDQEEVKEEEKEEEK